MLPGETRGGLGRSRVLVTRSKLIYSESDTSSVKSTIYLRQPKCPLAQRLCTQTLCSSNPLQFLAPLKSAPLPVRSPLAVAPSTSFQVAVSHDSRSRTRKYPRRQDKTRPPCYVSALMLSATEEELRAKAPRGSTIPCVTTTALISATLSSAVALDMSHFLANAILIALRFTKGQVVAAAWPSPRQRQSVSTQDTVNRCLKPKPRL